MTRTDLLVIGAGPYAHAAAAAARDHGIATHVVGQPMAWHLDARGEHTFEAFFEDPGLDAADHDPIPIGVDTGFASTRDFGPFYGFTKGCPSSARIAVDEMMR